MPQRVAKKPESLTRKQRSHLRRDQAQTRWVLIITAAIIVVVAGVIGYGYLNTYFLRVRQPAAIVYGETITIGQVQEEVRYQRLQLVASFNRLITFSTTLLDPTEAASLNSQAELIANQLSDKVALGNSALQFLIEAKIARREAAARGITVSDEEVQNAVNGMLGYIPAATLTAMPSPTITPTFTETSTPTLIPTVTAGGPTLTPSPSETPTATPTLTPTIGGTVTATSSPSLTPTITPIPTATPFTEQAFNKYYGIFIANIQNQTGMNEAEFRERVRSDLYIQKVRNAIMADVPDTEEQVHLEEIVLDDQQKAVDTLARLLRGEFWSQVCAEVSIDAANKDNSGDIGWISLEEPPTEIEKAAFALKVGEISQVLQTGANTWVILKVVDRDERPMNPEKYATMQSAAYQDWLNVILNDPAIVDKKGIPEELIPSKPNIS
jgi:parvulin-like peptidyl-prolyl isomerase